MANKEETTTKFKVDISELKAEFAQANRIVRTANSEFKAASDGTKEWESSSEGLSAKISSLNKVLGAEESKLESLKKQYQLTAQHMGENSKEAQELQIKINNQQSTINKTSADIKKYTNQLDTIGNASTDAGKDLLDLSKDIQKADQNMDELGESSEQSSGKLKGFLGALGGAAITGIGTAIAGLGAGLIGAVEGSKEFTDNMSKLNVAAKDGGYSADYATKSFENMYGVLGDETTANTTVSNFMAIGTSAENLDSLLNSSAGIWAKYGDSIPLDGLAESVNETGKVGTVTGTLADALNWAGVNEDTFNNSLAQCSSEQERQQLIVNTLNGLYGQLGTEYQNNNAAMISLNTAQMQMKQSISEIGTAFTPVLAMFTRFGAGMLQSIVPDVQNIATAFTNLTNGVEGADKQIGTAVSSILNKLVTSITSALPQITTIGVTILQGLVTGISQNSQSLVTSAGEIIMALVNGITTIAPQLIDAVIKLIPEICNELITLAPQIVMAVLGMWQTIADSLTQIDIGTAISNFITNLTNMIVTYTPQILDAGITLLMSLVNAIPTIIESLTAALPTIINTLVNYVTTQFPTLLRAAVTLFMALVRAIPQIAAALWEALPQIISAVYNGLKVLPSKLWEAIKGAFPKVIEWGANIKQKFSEKVTETIDGIKEWFSQLPQKIYNAIIGTVAKIAEWGANVKNKASAAARELVSNVVTKISEMPAKIGTFLTNIVNKFIDFAKTAPAKAKAGAQEIFNNIVNKVKEIPDKMLNIGENIVHGVWDGIKNAAGWLGNKISGFVGGIVDDFKNNLGIHSPSRIMRDLIGENIVLGIADGMKKKTTAVLDEVKSLTNLTTEPFSNIKTNFSNVSDRVQQKEPAPSQNVYNFVQNNNSPKALSRLEIYRQTKNQLNFSAGV